MISAFNFPNFSFLIGMCGIAAIFAYHSDAPNVDATELRVIRDHMKARGPDGAGEWFGPGNRVGLGHRRLSIIDLSEAGAQPMLWPERKLAITFNGEIYNYRELRKNLEAKGHLFRSQSDTEVLLHLYAEHGESMVNDLRGMFAFAIWDGQANEMFLARDPFGIKPLYVANDGRTLRVASQVKALLAGGRIDTAPNPAGHAGFFLWGHIPEPHTLYRGVTAMAAGSTLRVSLDGSRSAKAFCSIPKLLACAQQEPSPSGPPAGSIRTALVDSVAHHLIADVPVGVFLSSGLDSTSIAALAAEQGGTLRTVTLGFEEFRNSPNDEVPHAELMARQIGAQHQTIWVTRHDFLAWTDHLFDAMDQPTTDGVNTYFVSLAAHRAGLKAALSGLGGDELFGGYPSFTEIPRSVRTLRSLQAPFLLSFNRAFRIVSAPVIKTFTSPKYAGLLEYGGSYGGAYLLRRGMFMPWELPEVLDPELARAGWRELQTLSQLEETIGGIDSPRGRVAAMEICWYMRNQLLRDSDWAGMAHSLEIRVPLVDLSLLRIVAPLLAGTPPPAKSDMAQAPQTPLPHSIMDRPKTGFTIPVRQWLIADNPRRGIINHESSERGLRGWARVIYSRFCRN